MTQLTPNFTLEEFEASDTAQRLNIDNTVPQACMVPIEYTAQCLERIRTLLGYPIIISSGYRSPALNLLVGGQRNSQHMDGEAVDWTCPGFGTPLDVCRRLSKEISALDDNWIDELIYEFTWIHTSFLMPPFHNRGRVLTIQKGRSAALGLPR